jgi:hypothetical protein
VTFDQIVQRVLDRTNLSDPTAKARIQDNVNERYGWLCTSMGLQTSVQKVVTASTVIGSEDMTFGPQPDKVLKLMEVFNPAYPKPNVLLELSLDTLRLSVKRSEPAQSYAIYLMGADRVTIKLNTGAAVSVYPLQADAIVDKATLSGDDVPTFAAAFHNILFYGAMATEYDKLQQDDNAAKFEQKFETRCSELRLFIAKSIFKDIYQGKTSPGPVVVNRLV